MQRLIQKYLAAGLADFAGLTISGTIPVKQELINELIAEVLSEAAGPSSGSARPATPGQGDPIDTRVLLQTIKKLEISAGPGTVTIEFQLRA
jgi:hypothetical protein